MSRFAVAAVALTVTLIIGLALVFALDDNDGSEDAADTTEPPQANTTVASSVTVPTSITTIDATSSTSVTTLPSTTTTTTTPTTTSSSTTTTITPTTTPPTTSSPVPPFSISISTPTESQLSASWRPGCPVPVADLRLLSISHWGYDGKVRTGRLVVASAHVGSMSSVFEELYAARFPIERMEPVEAYGGDDDASMAANNTSAFNCRQVTGGSSFSEHSYGRAIDINPLVNPYVRGSTVLPPAGARYADRSIDTTGMIHSGDEVVSAFAGIGWSWGGNWNSLKDYQHFSSTGR
jgi:hypothetical protein